MVTSHSLLSPYISVMVNYYNEQEVAMRIYSAVRRTASNLHVAMGAMMFATGLMIAAPAGAQTVDRSVPRAEVVKLLGDRYAEMPVSMGLAQNGGVVEVFTTHDGATWTIVLTMPNGNSRVIGSGESWTSVAELAGRKV